MWGSDAYDEVKAWIAEQQEAGQHIITVESLGGFYTNFHMRITCAFENLDTAMLFKLTYGGEQ